MRQRNDGDTEGTERGQLTRIHLREGRESGGFEAYRGDHSCFNRHGKDFLRGDGERVCVRWGSGGVRSR